MLYNETIRKILEIKSYETWISLLKVFSYLCIFLAIYFFGLNSQAFTNFFNERETYIELRFIVAIETFIGIASSIFLTNSVFGIN